MQNGMQHFVVKSISCRWVGTGNMKWIKSHWMESLMNDGQRWVGEEQGWYIHDIDQNGCERSSLYYLSQYVPCAHSLKLFSQTPF